MLNHWTLPVLFIVSSTVPTICKLIYNDTETSFSAAMETCKKKNSTIMATKISVDNLEGIVIADNTNFWSGKFIYLSDWIVIKGCHELQSGVKGRQVTSDPVAQCYNWCDSSTHFGLKNTTCFCFGENVTSFSKTSEQLCNTKCVKTSYDETCGGLSSMTLYQIVPMKAEWNEGNKQILISTPGISFISEKDNSSDSCLFLNCLHKKKLTILSNEVCKNKTAFNGVCADNSNINKTSGTRIAQRQFCKSKSTTLGYTYSSAKQHCTVNEWFILNIYRRYISSNTIIRCHRQIIASHSRTYIIGGTVKNNARPRPEVIRDPSDVSNIKILTAQYCHFTNISSNLSCHDEKITGSSANQTQMPFMCSIYDETEKATTTVFMETTYEYTTSITSTQVPVSGTLSIDTTVTISNETKTTTKQNTKGTGIPTYAIVLLCVGILLVIIVISLLIYLKNRTRKTGDVEQSPDNSGSQHSVSTERSRESVSSRTPLVSETLPTAEPPISHLLHQQTRSSRSYNEQTRRVEPKSLEDDDSQHAIPSTSQIPENQQPNNRHCNVQTETDVTQTFEDSSKNAKQDGSNVVAELTNKTPDQNIQENSSNMNSKEDETVETTHSSHTAPLHNDEASQHTEGTNLIPRGSRHEQENTNVEDKSTSPLSAHHHSNADNKSPKEMTGVTLYSRTLPLQPSSSAKLKSASEGSFSSRAVSAASSQSISGVIIRCPSDSVHENSRQVSSSSQTRPRTRNKKTQTKKKKRNKTTIRKATYAINCLRIPCYQRQRKMKRIHRYT